MENTQNNNTQNKEEEPMSLQDEVLKAGKDTLIKRTKDKVNEKLDSGVDIKEILQGLLNSASSLAESPVATGDRMGLGTSLIKGHSTERPNYTKPLGMANAISLMKMQQDQKGEALDTKEQKLNIQKLQALIQSQTPEGQEKQLQQDIKKAKTIEVTKRKEKLTFERKQAGAKIDQNFNTLVGQFKGLVGQAKGAGEEQGGLGLLPGFLGKLNVAFKNPNFSRTAALPGQIAETSLVFNSILTGQNRVIKGVVEMIQSTLLTSMDPGTTIADKTAQSLTNAFRIKTAFHKVGLTPDVLDRMTQIQLDNLDVKGLISSVSFTKEETAQLEGIIQDVLATPAVQQRQLPGFEQKGKGPKQAPIGKVQSRLDAIQKRKAEIQAELKG